jgi:Glycoside hydrolase family 44
MAHGSGVIRPTAARLFGLAAIAMLLASGCLYTPGDPGTAGVTFTIDTSQANRPISPLIYGLNSPSAADLAATRAGLVRLGGNRWTAYNWETNASNAGSDYCFENDNYLTSSTTPGAAVAPTVSQAKAAGAAAIVTVPIVDYVAGDERGVCNIQNTPNYLALHFKHNLPAKGSAFSLTPNPGDANVYQDEFVNWLKQAVPGANVLIQLDNEPDLWSSTHAEVHPSPVTYQELALRDTRYASAIKKAWPTVKILGPVNYGYEGFVNLQNASDSGADGNFLDWYLTTMAGAGAQLGQRLIDDLDVHWYPEATGGGHRITDDASGDGAAEIAAREQAPRSLWDPTYAESSWITDDVLHGPIDLIPWIQGKIAAHYPGTGLSITEWDYGGSKEISGAIADADALGIFGQQGVAAAAYWPLASNETFSMAAFEAFRNYDGHDACFGDTSILASSSDVATATVYASMNQANHNQVTIIAINKATTTKKAAIKLTAESVFKSAKVYTVTSASTTPQPAAGIATSAQNAYLYTMPPQSISIIVPGP